MKPSYTNNLPPSLPPVSEKDLKPLKLEIERSKKIMIAGHRNPDGDALGSILGLSFVLQELGKEVTVYCPDEIPRHLKFLPGSSAVCKELAASAFDATVLADTPRRNIFPNGFQPIGTFIVIDHHRSYEEFGELAVRASASSVGEIIFNVARYAGWTISKNAAICLYSAIVSDTSAFRYESASADSHKAAAVLVELGADPHLTSENLFGSFTVLRQLLLGKVLNTLELTADGRFAVMYCTKQMMDDVKASYSDLEGIVNAARSIHGVELAVLLREDLDGSIRASLRSKGFLDASAVASFFNGGGHINAAGFRIYNMSMEQARSQLLSLLTSVSI